MKRIATMVENGKVVGLVHGPDATNQSVTVDGTIWRFDFDEYCGPLWTDSKGNACRNQNPPRRVWAAFQEWHRSYKAK